MMRFADELVDTKQFGFPAADGIRKPELDMAKALVNSLAAEWDRSKYTDQYRENLMRIIKGKMKGKKVELEPTEEPRQAEVVDLMERLRRSLEQRGNGAGRRRRRKTAAKPTARATREAPAYETSRSVVLAQCRLPQSSAALALDNDADVKPMLASLADAPLVDPELVYEPKYDGIRAIAEVAPDADRSGCGRASATTRPRSFPKSRRRWRAGRARRSAPVVLDGEIVALDAKGQPTGFQQLQGRIHSPASRARAPGTRRVAFIAFDLLRDGSHDLRERPLLERRAALERVFAQGGIAAPSPQRAWCAATAARSTSGRSRSGWEGLIAKHADSRYKSGKRTPDWRKLKIVHEQEFVIGGWTEPRRRARISARCSSACTMRTARSSMSATPAPASTSTSWRADEAAEAARNTSCPFTSRPKTNERPHWVEPTLVAQVKFTEWTADAKLRHPVYLGLRDDKKPRPTSIARRRRDAMRPHPPTRPDAITTRRRRASVPRPGQPHGRGEAVEELTALDAGQPARSPRPEVLTSWSSS